MHDITFALLEQMYNAANAEILWRRRLLAISDQNQKISFHSIFTNMEKLSKLQATVAILEKGPQRGSSPFQVLLVNVVDISCSDRLYLSQ